MPTIINSHQFQSLVRPALAAYDKKVRELDNGAEFRTEADYPNYCYIVSEFRVGKTLYRTHLTIMRSLDTQDYNIFGHTYVADLLKKFDVVVKEIDVVPKVVDLMWRVFN